MSEEKHVEASRHTQPRRGGPLQHGPMGPMGGGEKAKDFKGTMRKLLAFIGTYRIALFVVLILAVAGTVFGIFSPKILGQITTQVVEDYTARMVYDRVHEQLPAGVALPEGTTLGDIWPMMEQQEEVKAMLGKVSEEQLETFKAIDLTVRPSFQFDKIGQTAMMLIALYLISAVFMYVQGFVMSGISQKIAYRLRKDISAKINRMPLKYFDSKPFGDVLSRITNDIDMVSQTLNQSLSQIVTSITMLVGIIVMMFTISWQMTLIALVTLPASFSLIMLTIKKTQKHFAAQQKGVGDINGHVEEMYGGHSVMRVFGGEKRSVETFDGMNKELYEHSWKAQFLSGLMMPIMIFIGNIGYVGVCVVGGYLAINGQVYVGDIQAFISYMRQFTQPVAQMAQMANVLQSTAAAAERVFEFLGEEEEIPEADKPAILSSVRGDVTFEHVTFGYAADKTIIHDFSAEVKSGMRVAIVGPTGAGKTTLVNLLMRFYDVERGTIRIDGVDIRDVRRETLRKCFGMVLQDAWLFNGTIRENIAYGYEEATQADIERAARAAHVHHFIRSLPGGYDMELGEDATNISQGQKQLLTLARAMLEDAPMLILDEATSSVDTRTEVLIQQAMQNLMRGRTCFVIAHRLSTIRDADLILVLNEGNIVEQGTHAQLLALDGFYADLYKSQFETAEAS